MKKLLVVGFPILYLTGVLGFGGMYLSSGGANVVEAIAFGARWPVYIPTFFS